MPTTRPTDNWRDWNRTKSQPIERVLENLAKMSEPTPVTLVVFGGEKDYIDWMCNISDRIFAERVEYVFATPNWETYKDVLGETKCAECSYQPSGRFAKDSGSSVPIPRIHREILFPKLEGGTVEMEPSRVHWVEEQLELVHWNIGLLTDEQSSVDENAFLKGANVSWNDLRQSLDAERRGYW